jgi:acetyl esterase/lipase
MKPKTFIAVCSALILLFAGEAVAQKHLFLLSGQSNMARFKPEKVFIPAVEAEFGKDNVIVIKDAQGGQLIRRWYKGWKSAAGEVPESTGDLYDRLMQKVRPAIEGLEIKTVTFIWMQGEADAKASDGEVYAASLAGIIDQLRTDLKHQEINVVIGRLSDFGMDNQKCPHWTMIRDVQMAFTDSNPRYEWVDTDDLNDGADRQGRTRPNALHYSAEGCDILGRRYAQKAIALINLSAMSNSAVAKKEAEKNVPLINTEGGGFEPDKVVDYKADPKRPLQLHVFQPPGLKAGDARPAIVLFFGGGWSGTNTKQFYPQAEYLASRGMVAICATYRTTSAYKTEPYHCVEDGKSAIRYVRKHASELGINPGKVAAAGGSAGGHIAAAAATVKAWNCPDDDLSISAVPDALVLFNPVYDNGPGGYGNNEKDTRVADYWKKFSPLHNLDGNQPPTLVLMGSRDKHTSVETAQRYDQKMETNGNRCETIIYEGQKHGFFNLGKGGKEYFLKTIIEADRFLASFGFLVGEPAAKEWFAAQEKR